MCVTRFYGGPVSLRASTCRGVAISKLPMVEIASVAEFTLSVVEGLPRNDSGR